MHTLAGRAVLAGSVVVVVASAGRAQSYVQVTPGPAGVTASTSDLNVPANAVDKSLTTRWSGNGEGAWLQLDLGTTRSVARLRIAVHNGASRQNQFEIQVSADRSAWSTVWSGLSSGSTTALEDYDFQPASARWVRYLGHGNTVNTWNSVTEVEVYAVEAATCASQFGAGGPASQWIFYNASGRLSYRTVDSRGDRIMDFSHAGYKGGGGALPTAPARVTLSPTSSGDDTSRIQNAVNQVAAMAPDAQGIRGAVLLRAGTYRLAGTLAITASGVVLRGSGSGTGGTVIQMTGAPHLFLRLAGTGTWSLGASVPITTSYVPAGARTFTVGSTAGLAVGDPVLVERPVTSAWVHFMDMDTLVRNGAPQTWIGTSTIIRSDRVIAGISGNQVTLDVPVSDFIDASLLSPPGGALRKYTFPGRISQVGAESLRVVAPPLAAPINQANFKLLAVDAVVDGWVRNVFGQDFRSGLSVGDTAKRVTIQDTTLHHTIAPDNSAGAPGDFAISGTQTLVLRSKSTSATATFYALTQSTDVGPIVLLDFQGSGGTAIQPHQRWATGMLVDRANLSAGAIEFMNRGNLGSGHGWTMGWAVAWNSLANSYTIQRAPGTQNWGIGNRGTIVDRPRFGGPSGNLPRGAFDAHGTPVAPGSLYLAQLCDRLGPQAVANIGY